MLTAAKALWTRRINKSRVSAAAVSSLVFMLVFTSPALGQILVNPDSHFFGTVSTGRHSSPVSFSLVNTGQTQLEVTSISLAGGDHPEFSLAPGDCDSLTPTLAPGAGCTVEAVFSPASSGPKATTLCIASSDQANPVLNIPLQGDAVLLVSGDANLDQNVTLADALLFLQAAAGRETGKPLILSADVDGDGMIGIPEALFALHCVARQRSQNPSFFAYLPDFDRGERIPVKFTEDGENISPYLSGGNAPAGSKSFVIIMDDPDAPGGTWTHWIVYDFQWGTRALEENAGAEGGLNLPQLAKHGVNSYGNAYYNGPGPPAGPTHRYYFNLYAIDIPILDVDPNPSRTELEAAMEGHIVGKAYWMGTYSR